MLARTTWTMARAMGDVQTHVPKGIPKVKDKEVTLYVVSHEGNKHVVKGFVGEPLLYTLQNFRVPISGACRGGDLNVPYTETPIDTTSWGPSCSECQVVVSDPWFKYLKPMGLAEKHRLIRTHTAFVTPNSRLSCCLLVEKWMDGMHISVPLVEQSRPVGSASPVLQGDARVHRY